MTADVRLPERRTVSDVLATGASFGAQILAVNEPVAPHGHDYVELAFVLAGRCRHITRDGSTTLRRGHAVSVRACDWHSFSEPTGLVVANVYVDQMLLRAGLAPFAAQPALRMLAWPVPAQPSPGLADLPTSALREVEVAAAALADRAGRPSTAATGHLLVILGAFADALPPSPLANPHPGVLDAVHRLEADLAHPWTLPELAAAVGLSGPHLSRSFRRAFGAAPIEVLAGLRAERAAAHLIASNEPVALIGRRVGWPDPNYFARRFKAVRGCSPTEFRARLRTR
jgi:AraC family L-rhamnose operon transcriptional activator RhaR